MKLNHGLHLAYCTNVHPGESWAETFQALNRWTLAVRRQVPVDNYAIGLRLSDLASRELCDPARLLEFQRWLDQHGCYVFTINGFPFGRFHGGAVKERVYAPDWTTSERLEYTNRLFDLLSRIVPPGIEGSVSTSPGSFKEFIHRPEQYQLIRHNLWHCVEHISRLSGASGQVLHLGLEPEPLGLIENTDETVRFFEQLRDEHPGDPRLESHLGVNYDACHFAVEFEEPAHSIRTLREEQIRISKIHLSNALRVEGTAAARERLVAFGDDVYLHQLIERKADGSLNRYKDLLPALEGIKPDAGSEWRVHFHVPLHFNSADELNTTSDHVTGVLDLLQNDPSWCSHLEIETYTWAVLPKPLKTATVVDQIVCEYQWTLSRLFERGLADPALAQPVS